MKLRTFRPRTIPAAVLMALLVSTAAACGEDTPIVMPDVTTERLDVAKSDIQRIGYEDEVEVLGGGTFGVVDESNWQVCEQDPAPGETVTVTPRLTVERTCEAAPEETEKPVAEESEPEPAPQKTPVEAPEKEAPPAGTETFVMPGLVGQNLQDAQDRLQSLGSYVLTQTDGTGMERFQMVDANWQVCGQVPAAGKTVSIDTMVELIAVKLHESC